MPWKLQKKRQKHTFILFKDKYYFQILFHFHEFGHFFDIDLKALIRELQQWCKSHGKKCQNAFRLSFTHQLDNVKLEIVCVEIKLLNKVQTNTSVISRGFWIFFVMTQNLLMEKKMQVFRHDFHKHATAVLYSTESNICLCKFNKTPGKTFSQLD